MAWTKGQLVLKAVGAAGLGGILEPGQLNDAVQVMDAMLDEWYSKGIQLGYPLPVEMEGSKMEDDSKLPGSANAAVYSNLALRIAGDYGKKPPPWVVAMAAQGYNALCTKATRPKTAPLVGGFPAGAGNRFSSGPYLPAPEDAPLAPPEPSVDLGVS